MARHERYAAASFPYSRLPAILTSAIQELRAKNAELEAQSLRLASVSERLQAENEALKQELSGLKALVCRGREQEIECR